MKNIWIEIYKDGSSNFVNKTKPLDYEDLYFGNYKDYPPSDKEITRKLKKSEIVALRLEGFITDEHLKWFGLKNG